MNLNILLTLNEIMLINFKIKYILLIFKINKFVVNYINHILYKCKVCYDTYLNLNF